VGKFYFLGISGNIYEKRRKNGRERREDNNFCLLMTVGRLCC